VTRFQGNRTGPIVCLEAAAGACQVPADGDSGHRTIVRMVLVPAVMQLLGDRNWWIPDWLERSLPRLDVERVAIGTAEGRP
jgi:hypothetical protein